MAFLMASNFFCLYWSGSSLNLKQEQIKLLLLPKFISIIENVLSYYSFSTAPHFSRAGLTFAAFSGGGVTWCRWCLSLSFATWLLSLHPSTGAATCSLISWSRNARRWICHKSTFSNIKSLFLPPFEALRVKANPKQTNPLTRYFISVFQWGSTGGLVSSVYQRLTLQNYNLFKW